MIELSLSGFQAMSRQPLPLALAGEAVVELGEGDRSVVKATAVRQHETGGETFYGFRLEEPDASWRRCVAALETGMVSSDLAA